MSDSNEYKNIDPKILIELANGDNNFIGELISIFIEDVPKSYVQMEAVQKAGNLKNLAQLAHKLKPSTGMIVAGYAASLASNIEVIADSNDPDSFLQAMLSELKITLDSCCQELADYRSLLVP